jgi:hypothetical protein
MKNKQELTDQINIEINRAKQLPVGSGERQDAFLEVVAPLLDEAQFYGYSVEMNEETSLYELVQRVEGGTKWSHPTINLRHTKGLL